MSSEAILLRKGYQTMASIFIMKNARHGLIPRIMLNYRLLVAAALIVQSPLVAQAAPATLIRDGVAGAA